MALDSFTKAEHHPVGITPPDQPLSLWQTYRVARKNVLELVPEAAYRLPLLAGGQRPGWLMVMDPPWIEHILKTREDIYPKSDVTLRIFKPRQGESLFTSFGADWRWQQRALAPLFQQKSLRAIGDIVSAEAERVAARFDAKAGQIVDVYPEMVAMTCDVICEAALSGRQAVDRQAITEAVTGFVNGAAKLSLMDLLGVPRWVPRPAQLLDGSAKRMDDLMDATIAERRRTGPKDPADILDRLMAAEDPESGRRMSDIQIRNNLLAFIVAGHETTALSLTWALYLLAFDQRVQDRAREEAAGVLGARAATWEDLPKLGLSRRILDEALRLYPPAGFLARTAKAEDEIAGHQVKRGHSIMIPAYAVQRHAQLWEDPHAFNPDRFLPDAVRARHRFAYLPFSGGPRICIGMGLALMEAQIVLATLLARHRVTLPEGFRPRPRMVLTLRPEGGMPLRVERA